jgi:hypothetical protein
MDGVAEVAPRGGAIRFLAAFAQTAIHHRPVFQQVGVIAPTPVQNTEKLDRWERRVPGALCSPGRVEHGNGGPL